jgi:hypothetical protein
MMGNFMPKAGSFLVVITALIAACQSGAMPPTATPTSAPTSTPWPVLGPDANDDRVGFPEGYDTTFRTFYVFDRPDNKQIRVVYANDAAASAEAGKPFPYGSILVMETYRAVQDEQGNVVLDENGRFQRNDLRGIFVMRKEPGFGTRYQEQRTGEGICSLPARPDLPDRAQGRSTVCRLPYRRRAFAGLGLPCQPLFRWGKRRPARVAIRSPI